MVPGRSCVEKPNPFSVLRNYSRSRDNRLIWRLLMSKLWNQIRNIMLMIAMSGLLIICSPAIIIMELWIIYISTRNNKHE